MKKRWTTGLILMLLMVCTACGSVPSSQKRQEPEMTNTPDAAQPQIPAEPTPTPASTQDETKGNAILIAYFSRADENYNVGVVEQGNTEIVAEILGELTGGDLFHIETVNAYPADYRECTNVAQQEQRDQARPQLTETVENFAAYDTIFLGYPIWWGDMPMAVYTWLESYDFSGKTLIPFATHEGSGLGATENTLTDRLADSEVLKGLALRGSTAQNDREAARTAVENWLKEIGLSE